MNFKIIDDNKEIVCNIVLTFRDDNNEINYIVYEIDDEIYASRYIIKDNNYILEDIEEEYEWNLIDNMLESKSKGIDNDEKI